jgi:CRP-like cAMP-binding protein/ActR/RegA family two-component response regulator
MKTILVIEDNNDIREDTAEILELNGYIVLQAANGSKGVDIAQVRKPDLILCDVVMPELDGYGVLNQLRKQPETARIPFIFLAGETERTDFRKGMEMGTDDFLVKPFGETELLHALESRFYKKEVLEQYYLKSLLSLEKLTAGNRNEKVDLKTVIAGWKVKQIKRKQILYYEGDESSGLYLLLEGCIKTFKIADNGRELLLGLFKPEDYIGLYSLLSAENYSETAEAVSDSTVCVLPREMVIDMINRYQNINQQFIRMMASNIREKDNQLLLMAYNSVRKRLSQVLLRLSTPLSNPLLFKISREELAGMAGMAAETVSRILTDFKSEGLIERIGTHIKIIDHARLEKMKD